MCPIYDLSFHRPEPTPQNQEIPPEPASSKKRKEADVDPNVALKAIELVSDFTDFQSGQLQNIAMRTKDASNWEQEMHDLMEAIDKESEAAKDAKMFSPSDATMNKMLYFQRVVMKELRQTYQEWMGKEFPETRNPFPYDCDVTQIKVEDTKYILARLQGCISTVKDIVSQHASSLGDVMRLQTLMLEMGNTMVKHFRSDQIIRNSSPSANK